jgi:hypothetical protein
MIKGIDRLKKLQIEIGVFSRKVKAAAKSTARLEMNELRTEIIGRTPKDTGRARSKWSVIHEKANTLAFQLNVPYGFALDSGSQQGARPWPRPGPKTAVYKGLNNIYAGRIFSSQVADGQGGITAEVFDETRKGDIAAKVLASIEKELQNAMGR